MTHLDSLAGARSALLYEGWVARTHAPDFPLVYASGNEYRDREELNNILSQVQRLSLATTLLHPNTLIKFGGEARVVGAIVGGRIDERSEDLEVPHVVAQFVIWDAEASAAIADGMIELSLGYQAKLDENGYQRNIILDHLAIVPAGRCRTCELNPQRADSCDVDPGPNYRQEVGGQLRLASVVPAAILDTNMQTSTATSTNGITIEVMSQSTGAISEHADCAPCAAAGHRCGGTCTNRANDVNNEAHVMDELKKQLDEALKALEASKAEKAALEAELANAKADAVKLANEHKLALDNAQADLKVETARADALAEELKVKADEVEAAKKARSDAEDAEFSKRVDARIELLANAEALEVEDFKSKSDREIKVAIIAKVDEIDVEDNASVEYVNGMYAGALKRAKRSAKSMADVRETVKQHEDTAVLVNSPVNEEAERLASIKRREERFATRK